MLLDRLIRIFSDINCNSSMSLLGIRNFALKVDALEAIFH